MKTSAALSFTGSKRVRKSFGRIEEVAEMPNLIEVQRSSYETFLQRNISYKSRGLLGLQEVFKSVFPIRDFAGRAELEFVQYDLEEPKYDTDECLFRGMTYSAPLRVTFRLTVFDIDETTGLRSIRDIKEQDVYMVDMPLMTDNGTFIVNGTERVIVSQMHRSPGVFFDHDEGKTHSSGKFLFSARVIPYRGSWLDFEFDPKDLMSVRIDRRRKLPITTFLYALPSKEAEKYLASLKNGQTPDLNKVSGMSREEILNAFYGTADYTRTDKGWKTAYSAEKMKGVKLVSDLIDARNGKTVAEMGAKLTARQAKQLAEAGLSEILVQDEDLITKYVAIDILDPSTGEVVLEAGDEITAETLKKINALKIASVPTLEIDHVNVGAYLRNTMVADKNRNRNEALIDIYRIMRPGEPPTVEAADALLHSLFFDATRYDLSPVGRVKMNGRLNFENTDDQQRVLTKTDILAIIKVLMEMKDGRGQVDDIDHLGNRRVRSVGELMENQFRVGLLRMERAIRERMGSVDIETVMPNDLINAKPASAAVKEFFTSSQLSQFMDQTNPLSEVTHKRRMSALGPGGLSRERAGFEVRDVHTTHYGRICPIETPEGPNIGLINSLSTYARVNKYGFIETPYRKVVNGKVTDEVVYLSAMEEWKYIIAQANAPLNDKNQLTEEMVACRASGDYMLATPEQIQFIDVSPKQIVSVAASLIPFLENDDANRALMGSNMMRQAVPLIQTDAPMVGTGMEATVAIDSGAAIRSTRDGIVDQVDAKRIVIRATDIKDIREPIVDIYRLRKFSRTNQNTCINQRPLVKVGDMIRAGDIIADGPSTDLGELALGRNVLCAFMPWNGYNFEDSILLSERIVRDDIFTSIHIEEFEVMARDTKLGQEDITRDIPNTGEEALKHLDEAGIAYIGAEVIPGDILVGKVTPKGESPITPEEKLLRAIFGEKAADVKDSSLRVPPGVQGTVVDVRVFSRRGIDKDERTLAIEQEEIESLAVDRDDERRIIERGFYDKLKELMVNKFANSGPKGFEKGSKITESVLAEYNPAQWRQFVLKDDKVQDDIEAMSKTFDEAINLLKKRFESKVEKLQRGAELMPGVLKMVKVYVAVKRKMQPGDKMAGRHGNKGVVSRVLPIEDMPHLADGTSVDIVLNPLGVPSRMNVGQILETHLGWASASLGKQIGELVENYQSQSRTGKADDEMKSLKSKLQEVYGEKDYQFNIKPLKDDQIVEMAGNLRKGVPFATPVFDGAQEMDINNMLEMAGLQKSGQVTLFDGRTGTPFERQITVGYIYMLKLAHLVDDKIHARSIGPYSLVTQQPLGGKAQFGGQRFGEMEVWALQAYGAAYTLQELLTVKSDDVAGRTKAYESIVRGENTFEIGIPESFNVLVKEMKSLGLNVELNSNSF